MPYTLTQAAKAIGKNKTTVLRAINAGKLSAVRDPRSSGWVIEPVELHRIYPRVVDGAALRNIPDAVLRHEPATATLDNLVLRHRLESAETRITEKDDQIADLRRRLDQESDDRRKLQSENHALQAKLTAVLSDQRSTIIPVAEPVAPGDKSSDDLAPRKNRGWLPWRRRRRS